MWSINAKFIAPLIIITLSVQGSLSNLALAQENSYRRSEQATAHVPRPEDLVHLPDSAWIIVSSMRGPKGEPGRLFAVNAASLSRPHALYPSPESRKEPDRTRFGDCVTPPDLRVFYPHGLGVVSTKNSGAELFVVNHGGRESIEFFRLNVRSGIPRATWIGCILLPGHDFGNGVAPLPGGGFVVTNMYDTTDTSFLRKFAAAEPTGDVLRWTPAHGWSKAEERPLSGANGVEVSADGKWLYVSEWAARKFWVFALNSGTAPRSVDLDFLPDNLRWTNHGTLLLAGQNTSPEKLFDCQAKHEPCPLGFTVVEINPQTLNVRVLAEGGDDTFGGATGALQVGRDLWVGSFRGDVVGRFVPVRATPRDTP